LAVPNVRWKKKSSLSEGDKFTTKYNRDYTIGKYIKDSNSYECIFTDIIKICALKEIRSGQILHPEDKTVQGVGYLGKGSYNRKDNPDAYRKWQGMIKRVHSNDPHYRQYKEFVGICDEWYSFQNFCSWYCKVNTETHSLELDKDLYYLDKPLTSEKVYSPETCCLLTKNINIKLSKFTYEPRHSVEGRKYRVNISVDGVVYELGRYSEKFNADMIKILTFIGSLQKMLKDNSLTLDLNIDQIMENYKEVYENR
jgi:hypothetical protein